jgi:hypothetical protein
MQLPKYIRKLLMLNAKLSLLHLGTKRGAESRITMAKQTAGEWI